MVDATDRLRIDDCRTELHGLLQEEVERNALRAPPLLLPYLTDTRCRDFLAPVSWFSQTKQMWKGA